MTYAVVIAVVVILAIVVLVAAARTQVADIRSVEELLGRARPVDLEAFRNLTDPQETRFLRESLGGPEFRTIQRERMRAASEYVRRTAYNAALLMKIGAAARNSSDKRVSDAAVVLSNDALQLRLLSLAALAVLRVNVVFPAVDLTPSALTDRYESLRTRVAALTRLQQPAITSRVLSAL